MPCHQMFHHDVKECLFSCLQVFHQGEVKEFDTPYNLMQLEDGYFTRLVEHLGRRQAQHLRSLAELSHQQRASASLMLEHAVFMATEQLQASTEDLTFRPGSLAWSNRVRFSKSQDSLEKAHSDWGSRGDIQEVVSSPTRPKANPSMAPAQKLINKRRMSPSRGKRPMPSGEKEEGAEKEEGCEQLPLLSYNTPPKPVTRNSAEKGETQSGRGEKGRSYRPDDGRNVRSNFASSPLVDYNSSPRLRVHSPTDQNAPSRAVERRVLETSIDTPPVPRRNFSPLPSNAENNSNPTAAATRIKGRSEVLQGRTPARRGYQSPGSRMISGEYSPPAQDGREDAEKIIYC